MGPKKKLLGIIASLVGALVGALVLPPSDGAMVGLPLSVGAVGAAVPLAVGAAVPLVVGAVVPLVVGAVVFGVGSRAFGCGCYCFRSRGKCGRRRNN